MGFAIGLMIYLISVLFPMIIRSVHLHAHFTDYNSQNMKYLHQPVIFWFLGGCPPIQLLERISEELFHPDQSQRVAICIVSRNEPTQEMANYISIQRGEYELKYVEGSLMSDDTCMRAGLAYAKACILMPSFTTPVLEMASEDEMLCLAAIRMRQFTDDRCILNDSSVPDPARIVLVLNRSGNDFTFTDSFYGATKDGYFHTSFSYLELQYQTIAKSISCPGFNCFISSIFGHTDVSKQHLGYSTQCSAATSATISKGATIKDVACRFPDKEDQWLQEYFAGAQADCYDIQLPATLKSVDLAKLSAVVYQQKGVILFAFKDHETCILAQDPKTVSDVTTHLETLCASDIDSSTIWDLVIPEAAAAFAAGACIPEPKPNTFSDELIERLRIPYTTQAFYKAYGPIPQFIQRHQVVNPEERALRSPLVQKLTSCLFNRMENHVILVGADIAHVSHFVRELRQVSETDTKDIVIVTSVLGNKDIHTILCMFEGVYLVQIPEDDNGYVSRESLLQLNVQKASWVVLTHAAHELMAGDSHSMRSLQMEHHQMVLRLVVHKFNPSCKTIIETRTTRNARFSMEGTRDCNAWSSAEEIANSHHSLIAKRWAEYPHVVNRAACIASGQFIEQEALVSLISSVVHERNSNLNLLQAMLGGNKFNFTLKCLPVHAACVGRDLIDTYATLCSTGVIPLALFRRCCHSKQRYIVTQPHPNTQIQEDDLIYIAIQQSNDDIGDDNEFGFACCGLLGCCDDTQAEVKPMEVEVGVPQDK